MPQSPLPNLCVLLDIIKDCLESAKAEGHVTGEILDYALRAVELFLNLIERPHGPQPPLDWPEELVCGVNIPHLVDWVKAGVDYAGEKWESPKCDSAEKAVEIIIILVKFPRLNALCVGGVPNIPPPSCNFKNM